jgi:anti-sigma factor RsiW
MSSCSDIRPALSELADGTLTGERRTRVESHLERCPACRGVVADLRRIREAAAVLPKMTPPDNAWPRIYQAIEGERAGAAPGPALRPAARRLSWWPAWGTLALAATLVIAVSGGLYVASRRAAVPEAKAKPPAEAAAHVGGADLVQSVESELQQADQHYEKAIAGLEQIAREGQGNLDPQTAAVLQKNVGIIDQAIRESRAALAAQPASELAQQSLFDALRKKAALLQETVSLINEMRKGNQAGAARIVGDISK